MREPDTESHEAADNTHANPASRYDGLISLQLETDAGFDLRRSAWRRVADALSAQLCGYMGCEPGRVVVCFESPSRHDLALSRPATITVHLANGFSVDVPAQMHLWLRTVQSRRDSTFRDGHLFEFEGNGEMLTAYSVAGKSAPKDEYRPASAEVLELHVEHRKEFSALIPIGYFLDTEGNSEGRRPHEFSSVLQSIGENGEFTPQERAIAAISNLGQALEQLVKDEITANPAARAAKRDEAVALPPWL